MKVLEPQKGSRLTDDLDNRNSCASDENEATNTTAGFDCRHDEGSQSFYSTFTPLGNWSIAPLDFFPVSRIDQFLFFFRVLTAKHVITIWLLNFDANPNETTSHQGKEDPFFLDSF